VNPLVSVIVPYKPSHERFLPLVSRRILSQTYPNIEVVCKKDERGIGCGPMRNELCEEANGDIVAMFDVDDWYPADYVNVCVSECRSGADVVGTGKHWIYDSRNHAANMADRYEPRCGTLVFWRQAWQNHPFPNVADNEVVLFLRAHRGHIVDLKNPDLYVQFLHSQNTIPYGETRHHDSALERIRALLGSELDEYLALTG
jgi:hypothetical protein